MSIAPRSLSPAQIQYLKIGPKAGNSEESKKLLAETLLQEKNKAFAGETSANSSLNKIPKMTYGQFEKTVSNFGVLINKNFGNQTTLHQSQKFGKMVHQINKYMVQEKDKPMYSQKKNALLKKIKDRSDNRTSIKAVYDFSGNRVHVALKSFTLSSQKTSEVGLPIPYLRFLINHVNSSRLSKIIEPSLKNQGNQVVVEFDKIQGRATHLSNNEAKYQNIPYNFQRFGQILDINLPVIQFSHIQSKFNQEIQILNKQIIEIVDSNFDNIGDIAEKYLDSEGLQAAIESCHDNGKSNNQIQEDEDEQEQIQ